MKILFSDDFRNPYFGKLLVDNEGLIYLKELITECEVNGETCSDLPQGTLDIIGIKLCQEDYFNKIQLKNQKKLAISDRLNLIGCSIIGFFCCLLGGMFIQFIFSILK